MNFQEAYYGLRSNKIPITWPAFWVEYSTEHLLSYPSPYLFKGEIFTSSCKQFCHFLLIAEDLQDAKEFFAKFYEPCFAGKFNKLINVTFTKLTGENNELRYWRPAMHFTENFRKKIDLSN